MRDREGNQPRKIVTWIARREHDLGAAQRGVANRHRSTQASAGGDAGDADVLGCDKTVACSKQRNVDSYEPRRCRRVRRFGPIADVFYCEWCYHVCLRVAF